MEIKAYIYSRWSSAKQAKGDSERRQYQECYAFATELGVPIDTKLKLKDDGISGYTGLNRIKGALGEFIKAVERGEVARGSYLLVDSMDRISREDETQVLNLLTGLALRGIRLCNVSERHILPEKPDTTDWIRLLIHASRSHQESQEKARKIRKAHVENKDRARAEGRIWHKKGPHWLAASSVGEKKERVISFALIPEKVAVIERVYDLIETGLGTTAIAKRLNDEGVSSPNDAGRWHHSTVLEIAKNRAVLGEYQPKSAVGGMTASRRPKEGDPRAHYYPDIITEAQFYRVQAAISKRSPVGRRPNSHAINNLFVGLGVCGDCGGRIGYSSSNSRRNPDWNRAAVLRCYNSSVGATGPTSNQACQNRNRYKYDPLEAAILRHVIEFDLPDKRPSSTTNALIIAEAQATNLRKKIENLEEEMENGVKGLGPRMARRQAELETLERELIAIRQAHEAAGAAVPILERQKALQSMLARMATVEGAELYDLRAAICESLKAMIDMIDFDIDGSVRVIIAGGARAYQFHDGALTGSVDLMPIMDDQLRAGLTGNDPDQLDKLRKIA